MVAKLTGVFAHFDLSSDIECELLATALELYLNGNRDIAGTRNGIAPLAEKQFTTVETIARHMDQSPLMSRIMQEYMQSIKNAPKSGPYGTSSAIAREIELYAVEEAMDTISSAAYEAAKVAWNDGAPLQGGNQSCEVHKIDYSSRQLPYPGMLDNPSTEVSEAGYSGSRTPNLETGVRDARSSKSRQGKRGVLVREVHLVGSQPASLGAGVSGLQLPDFSNLGALFPNILGEAVRHLSTGVATQYALPLGDGCVTLPKQSTSDLDGADDNGGDSHSKEITYDEDLTRALQQSEMAWPRIPPSQPSLEEPAGIFKNVGYYSSGNTDSGGC